MAESPGLWPPDETPEQSQVADAPMGRLETRELPVKPYKFDYSEVVRPYHASLFNRVAGQANRKLSLDAVWEGAKRGYTLEEQDELSQQVAAASAYEARMQELMAQAQELAQRTVSLDDDAFRGVLGQIQQELSSPARAPGRPGLRPPSWQQGLAAVLGALTSQPQHRLDVLSAPLKQGLVDQERAYQDDVQRYQVDEQERQRRLQFLSGLADDELRLAGIEQQAQQGQIAREYDQVQGQMRALSGEREFQATQQQRMLGELNNQQSVAGLGSSFGAYEMWARSNGVALPDNWEQFKSDTLGAAERKESANNIFRQWQEEQRNMRADLKLMSDPRAMQASRGASARRHIARLEAAGLTDTEEYRYMRQELEGFALDSVDQAYTRQRTAESEERVRLIVSQTGLNELRADKLSVDLEWLPVEKQVAVAKGLVAIDLAKSLIADRADDNRRGWASLDQQRQLAINDDIRLSLEELRRESATIEGSIRALRGAQSYYKPDSAQWQAIEAQVAGEQARLGAVQGQMSEIRSESERLGDEINPSAGRLKALEEEEEELRSEVEEALRGGNAFDLARVSQNAARINDLRERRARLERMIEGRAASEAERGAGVETPNTDAAAQSLRRLNSFMDEWASVPYKFGGKGKAGVDCSGFATRLIPEVFGGKVSGGTAEMLKQGVAVEKPKSVRDLQPGDAIFFASPSSPSGRHVSVYIGNGMIAEAANSRKGVVQRSVTDAYLKSATAIRRYR